MRRTPNWGPIQPWDVEDFLGSKARARDVVPWSTLYRARVRNNSVLASTRGPAVRPQFFRELPEPSGSEQASGIIMTAWAGGAVEQPTITGRTRRAPDSIQPLFADLTAIQLKASDSWEETSIGCCEVPIGLCVVGIAIVLPSGDFVDEGVFVGDAAVEALGR